MVQLGKKNSFVSVSVNGWLLLVDLLFLHRRNLPFQHSDACVPQLQ